MEDKKGKSVHVFASQVNSLKGLKCLKGSRGLRGLNSLCGFEKMGPFNFTSGAIPSSHIPIFPYSNLTLQTL
jgi:hypothetical protein